MWHTDIKTQYLRGASLFVPPGWDGTQDLVVYGSMCFTPKYSSNQISELYSIGSQREAPRSDNNASKILGYLSITLQSLAQEILQMTRGGHCLQFQR